ncbi:MAG: mandelate racemase [Gammaproteobacteria bacterium]|nr:mandelate racemase [Gammaproteobacteria bacterium]
MSSPPRLRVIDVECFEQPYRLRLPFRFGVITVTEGIQAIVRVRIRRDDGREAVGHGAEALGAKWFDKNPALSDAQNLHQLRKAIELCKAAYLAAPALTAFDLFAEHYAKQLTDGARIGLPPLVASYGPAMIDRAVADALCRLEVLSFAAATNANRFGLRPHAIVPDLDGFDFGSFLASLAPAATLQARHTVGLVDPIVAADQPPGTRVDDGLPETLEEVVRYYGNRYYKLKVSGQPDADLDRLIRIASVLETIDDPYHVTLDGNEQFDDAEAIADLWLRMKAKPELQRLCNSTLFIEQPIKRQAALARDVAPLARHLPVIIDESDGDLAAFPAARECGYAGVSTKLCKGFYKSLVNLARCRSWNVQGAGRFFMSAEDLTTQAGISVQQDLALVSLLGITHVERNAHHFIDGFAGRSEAEAQTFLAAHPDLYAVSDGKVRLKIDHGVLHIGSLQCAGFASAVAPSLDRASPMPAAQWPDATAPNPPEQP